MAQVELASVEAEMPSTSSGTRRTRLKLCGCKTSTRGFSSQRTARFRWPNLDDRCRRAGRGRMRVFIVDTYYPAFLEAHYSKQPELAEAGYDVQWRSLMD